MPAPEGLAAAPFRDDVAQAPRGGRVFWTGSADGLRLRLGFWSAPDARGPDARRPDASESDASESDARGTVFLLPGRTEYLEKYGPVAGEILARGYSVLAVDWRGQGLSDRPFDTARHPREKGHIAAFAHFQRDLDAMLDAARRLGAPRPWFALSHSMAGAILLRRLTQPGQPFAAAAFSAPMWGVGLPRPIRPFGAQLARLIAGTRLGAAYVPSTAGLPYVLKAPFEGNLLTPDAAGWAFLADQARRAPELGLAGPSLHWVAESVLECRALAALPSPPTPAYVAMGADEKVIDPAAVRARAARWPQARLEVFAAARHEIMMDAPDRRARFLDACAALFAAAS